MSKKREAGFYWVRFWDSGGWRIAYYCGQSNTWCVQGLSSTLTDAHFNKIDEDRIPDPKEDDLRQ